VKVVMLSDREYVNYAECLTRAGKLLDSADKNVTDRNISAEATSRQVDYKIKLAYAWMDLAQKLK